MLASIVRRTKVVHGPMSASSLEVEDDRTPVIRTMRDVGFPCMLTRWRSRHEAQALSRRKDHGDVEGG
jgi:hypothetical protein